MPFLELFDETLDINATENYALSVQVCFDRISFSILDTIRKKFVLIREYEPGTLNPSSLDRIEEFIRKDDFLSRHYSKVSVITPASRFTLIPTPIFDPLRKDDYYNFNHIAEEGNIIISDQIHHPDAYIVYSLQHSIKELTDNFFKNAHSMHHLKPLLNYIADTRKGPHGNHIHLHIEKEFFNIIILDHSTLRLCNTFYYRNSSDILYYLLSVFRNLSISGEETIYLSGLTSRSDDLSKMLSIYVRNIRYAVPSNRYSFSYVFNDIELHRYINIFNALI